MKPKNGNEAPTYQSHRGQTLELRCNHFWDSYVGLMAVCDSST